MAKEKKENYKKCFKELWKACFVSESIEEMEQAFGKIKEEFGKNVTCEVAGQLLKSLKEKQNNKN